MGRAIRGVLLTTGLLLYLVGTALAQAPGPDSPERVRSKELVAKGNSHFQLGEFAVALKLYKDAYRVRPSPNILFNIGQTHRQLGQLSEALFAFKNYLLAAPADAANRADV